MHLPCNYHNYVLKDRILAIIFLPELVLSGGCEIFQPWGLEAAQVFGAVLSCAHVGSMSQTKGAHPGLLSPPAWLG